MSKFRVWLFGFILIIGMPGFADDKPVITIYAPDYFASEWGPGPTIKESFEEICNCSVNYVTGNLLPRLLLEGAKTEADIVKLDAPEKDLFIGCMEDESRLYAQSLGYKIRKNNTSIIVESYLGNANVGKQLKKADSQGFKFAIIVGQDELKSKKVKLKNLKEDKPDLELKEKDLLENFKC